MFTARLAIYHYWLFKMEFIQESFFSSVACSESLSKTCFFSRQQCIGIPSTRQRFQKLFWFLRGYVILLLHSHQLYVLHTHGNDISVNQTLNHSRFSFTFIHPTYKRYFFIQTYSQLSNKSTVGNKSTVTISSNSTAQIKVPQSKTLLPVLLQYSTVLVF